jgi:hypothetical protein
MHIVALRCNGLPPKKNRGVLRVHGQVNQLAVATDTHKGMLSVDTLEVVWHITSREWLADLDVGDQTNSNGISAGSSRSSGKSANGAMATTAEGAMATAAHKLQASTCDAGAVPSAHMQPIQHPLLMYWGMPSDCMSHVLGALLRA